MAITTVRGTITRTFFDGKGAEVTEVFMKRDGTEGKTRWAAFFDERHGLVEGAAVEVSGMHGDKIDEWEAEGETRRTVKRTLNKARVKAGEASAGSPASVQGGSAHQSAPVAPNAPQGDVGGFSFDEKTPF